MLVECNSEDLVARVRGDAEWLRDGAAAMTLAYERKHGATGADI